MRGFEEIAITPETSVRPEVFDELAKSLLVADRFARSTFLVTELAVLMPMAASAETARGGRLVTILSIVVWWLDTAPFALWLRLLVDPYHLLLNRFRMGDGFASSPYCSAVV